MADLCEICMRIIEFREEGARIDYDEWVLCAECYEEISLHSEKYPRKGFERCVEEIRKKNGNTS